MSFRGVRKEAIAAGLRGEPDPLSVKKKIEGS